jgi:ATP-dependent Clp protease ATP-binding subunit ClpC
MIAQFQNFNIIVFDEIEKAHPKIHQALLGIMDDGKITLSNLQEIDFSESIIIMTSNIGEREKREFNARKSI